MHIILASGSPRRKDLLKTIFNEFEILVPDIEEIVPPDISPYDGPVYLAEKKARKIAENSAFSIKMLKQGLQRAADRGGVSYWPHLAAALIGAGLTIQVGMNATVRARLIAALRAR